MVKNKKRKTIQKITIRKVILNNKSRKGTYYYIREKNGKPKYYKVNRGVPVDNYVKAYKKNIKVGKKGITKETIKRKSRSQEYIEQIERTGKIKDLISKGRSETDIPNFTGSKTSIYLAHKRLLKPLVKDKRILNILAREENMKKLKERIESKIVIESSDGKVLIPLKIFNRSLPQIENDFKEIRRKKDVLEEDFQKILKKGYRLDGIPDGVDITGYGWRTMVKRIGKIKIKMRFVKG